MTTIEFDAFDYRSDQSFTKARYRLVGSSEAGWLVERDGQMVLELGPGYRALRVRQCGVCSTDLARHLLTELVVDELAIARFDPADVNGRRRVAWLLAAKPPAAFAAAHDLQRGTTEQLVEHYCGLSDGLPRADVAVVDSIASVESAIRPVVGREQPLVRPRGSILVLPDAAVDDSPLLLAIRTRGLRLSSSRCGDFRSALELLATDAVLRGIGERLITHRFAAQELPAAFAVARSRACIKAVVAHDG